MTLPGVGILFPSRIEDRAAGGAGGSQWIGSHLGLRRLGADLVNVPRYAARYVALVLVLLGLLNVWEACGDGPIPEFCYLTPSQGLNPYLVSAPHCIREATPDGTRWDGLAGPLKVLDKVNPRVAGWVREKRDRGQLRFTDGGRRERNNLCPLAKHDALDRTLTINRGLFAENDGTVATILCHEYRHSRQSLPKVVKYAISFLVRAGGDSSIVETDALLYEEDARTAVFGYCPPDGISSPLTGFAQSRRP
jgi:hypothetical protein